MKKVLIKILPTALILACLAGMLSLSACSSSESSTSGENTTTDPKYAIQLFINCDKNLIFSKYNVDVKVDNESIGNVEHGGEATFEVKLAKGQHELVLTKSGATSPDGKTSFVVEKEGDKFAYTIRCTNDQIEIESNKDETSGQSNNDKKADNASTKEDEPNKSAESTAKEDAEKGKQEKLAKDLEACKDQSAAHAYVLVKDSGYKYKFEVSNGYVSSDITNDMEDKLYANSRERAKVTSVDVDGLNSLATFTIDRPLAITVEDSEDLARLLNTESMTDPFMNDFANNYKGKNIEFDGSISAHFPHGNNKTRFDYYIIAENNTNAGMPFFFEDVNHSDFHWSGKSPDSVDADLACHFIARVEKYDVAIDSTPIIYLDPVQTSLR